MHRPIGRRSRGVLRDVAAGLRLCSIAVMALCALVATSAAAQKGADWTAKLEPRTRAMQVCSLAGLGAFARDKKLRPKPDRVVINAGGEPKIDAASVSGAKAAVRSGSRWYAFAFTCKLNDTGTKAASFTYDLGAEIPKAQWEKLGLWQ
jgi:Domain of Unknown Function (DUF930)